jgi:hypothetical protein
MKINFPHSFIALTLLLLAAANPGAARAQNTMFTYQGRVTDNGTNFNGPGQFKFALIATTNVSSQATASAILAGVSPHQTVTNYVVFSGGSGYTTVPVVTITGGGGSGATATAQLTGGMVTGLLPGSFGSGYTGSPTVTIAPPPVDLSNLTYWSNDGASVNGSQPTALVNVMVNDGLFTLTLGDTNRPNMTAIPAAIFNEPNLQLRIWFNDGVKGFAQLNPPQILTPTPYAVTAGSLNGLLVQQNADGAPNVIGGASVNSVSNGVTGATISGGGSQFLDPNTVLADFGTVGGGFGNTAGGQYSIIGGGVDNLAGSPFSTVSGGEVNTASGFIATIGGGVQNKASGTESTVSGGDENQATNDFATVGGGIINVAGGNASIVSGGRENIANGVTATICGGNENTASGILSTVCGGFVNVAAGQLSFAAGDQAEALHDGSFVWADSQGGAYASTRNNQFSIRAGGGVVMNVSGSAGLNPAAVSINSSSGTGIGLVVNESSSDTATIFANNGTGDLIKGLSGNGNMVFEVKNNGDLTCHNLTQTSDRNAKENFQPLDFQQVLAQVASLPLSKWNYKTDHQDVQHIGPMAQDFQAAFGLNGQDDKHISVIDEGGVALAVIQALNQKLGSGLPS